MPQEMSLEESYLILFRFLLLSKRRVFEIGTEHGLTGMQTMMLILLDCPRQMSSFSKIFNCDASNITGLVDGLEQKELAMRYEDSNDRRVKMVQLEAKGKRLRTTLFKDFTSSNGPLLSALTKPERKTFTNLLEKITHGTSDI